MSIYDIAKCWFFAFLGIGFLLLFVGSVAAATTGETSPDGFAGQCVILAIIALMAGAPGWAISMADNRPLSERRRKP